jgi:serine/threonine-protein kinase
VTPTKRRQQITDLFERARQLPPEKRSGFLERECGGDEDLQHELDSLLSADRRLDDVTANHADSPKSEPPPVPKHEIGKYQITGILGAGGFGRVYKALNPTIDHIVAIKELNASRDLNARRRLLSEAKILVELSHPNIVTVYDFFEEEGAPYLVMEYLDGTTLQELIRRNALSLLEKVEVMWEVAEGLKYAHNHGVIHRDIKPANIMWLADGSVKIMDFGIARTATQDSTKLTQTGFIVGSLPYTAPERFSEIEDALSDVFAYGTTFYELLTGQNPFFSPYLEGIVNRILNMDVPPVRAKAPDCPEALDRLVLKAMARAREDRYSTLSDVIDDAEPILLQLRRDYAGPRYTNAERLFAAQQLDEARSEIRTVLKLDPDHAGAKRLKSQIEEALRLRDVTARAMTLMESVERKLAMRQYTEASSDLSKVRTLSPGDSQLKSRVDRAEAQLEEVRRLEKLLDDAREYLKNQGLTKARCAVWEVLSSDPANTAGKQLWQEIEEQIRRRIATLKSDAAEFVKLQEYDKAIWMLRKGIADFGDDGELTHLLQDAIEGKAALERGRAVSLILEEADRLRMAGKLDEATRAIEEAMQIWGGDPRLTELLRQLTTEKKEQDRKRAIHHIGREIRALLDQGKPEAASAAARQCIRQHGEAPEIQELLALAESRIRDRDRSARLQACLAETRNLATAGRLEEALQRVEDGIREFPGEASLEAERKSVVDSLDARKRGQAILDLLGKTGSLIAAGNLTDASLLIEEALQKYGQDPRLLEVQQLVSDKLAERNSVTSAPGSVTKRISDPLGKTLGVGLEEPRTTRAFDWLVATTMLLLLLFAGAVAYHSCQNVYDEIIRISQQSPW